jgi:hypothetical protein
VSHDIGINMTRLEAGALQFLLKHLDSLESGVFEELHQDYGNAVEWTLWRVV